MKAGFVSNVASNLKIRTIAFAASAIISQPLLASPLAEGNLNKAPIHNYYADSVPLALMAQSVVGMASGGPIEARRKQEEEKPLKGVRIALAETGLQRELSALRAEAEKLRQDAPKLDVSQTVKRAQRLYEQYNELVKGKKLERSEQSAASEIESHLESAMLSAVAKLDETISAAMSARGERASLTFKAKDFHDVALLIEDISEQPNVTQSSKVVGALERLEAHLSSAVQASFEEALKQLAAVEKRCEERRPGPARKDITDLTFEDVRQLSAVKDFLELCNAEKSPLADYLAEKQKSDLETAPSRVDGITAQFWSYIRERTDAFTNLIEEGLESKEDKKRLRDLLKKSNQALLTREQKAELKSLMNKARTVYPFDLDEVYRTFEDVASIRWYYYHRREPGYTSREVPAEVGVKIFGFFNELDSFRSVNPSELLNVDPNIMQLVTADLPSTGTHTEVRDRAVNTTANPEESAAYMGAYGTISGEEAYPVSRWEADIQNTNPSDYARAMQEIPDSAFSGHSTMASSEVTQWREDWNTVAGGRGTTPEQQQKYDAATARILDTAKRHQGEDVFNWTGFKGFDESGNMVKEERKVGLVARGFSGRLHVDNVLGLERVEGRVFQLQELRYTWTTTTPVSRHLTPDNVRRDPSTGQLTLPDFQPAGASKKDLNINATRGLAAGLSLTLPRVGRWGLPTVSVEGGKAGESSMLNVELLNSPHNVRALNQSLTNLARNWGEEGAGTTLAWNLANTVQRVGYRAQWLGVEGQKRQFQSVASANFLLLAGRLPGRETLGVPTVYAPYATLAFQQDVLTVPGVARAYYGTVTGGVNVRNVRNLFVGGSLTLNEGEGGVASYGGQVGADLVRIANQPLRLEGYVQKPLDLPPTFGGQLSWDFDMPWVGRGAGASVGYSEGTR